MSGPTYKSAGVDVEAGAEFAKSIYKKMRSTFDPRVMENPYGFAALIALEQNGRLFRRGYRRPVLVTSTDGVGTKLKVAFMCDKHDTVGIDLVAMCVNDILTQGAEPIFFLDYLATGKLQRSVLDQIIDGICHGCRLGECSLVGGETAEMPGFYAEGEYDMAGFAVGVVERKKLIDPSRTVEGDVLVGVSSSGLHSNGYSLARKVFFEHAGWTVDRDVPEFGRTLGEELLEPTLIYTPAVRSVLSRYSVKRVVRSISHITGGGIPENLARVLPPQFDARVRSRSWEVPPVFAVLQELGGIDREEMFRTFNMGIGLILVCSKYFADAIVAGIAKTKQFKATIIGEIVAGNGKVVIE